ncbi:MAG: Modification methylase MboII [Verrucomicrobiota bacterium]
MPVKRPPSLQIEMPVSVARGLRHTLNSPNCVPQLQYEASGGKLSCGDSIEWLRTLDAASVDLVFADPPYNIRKAEWDDLGSMQEYTAWSRLWIGEAARVLKATGTLYVCGFSEILADVKVAVVPLFDGCRWLVWHYKNKANLGNGWGRSHESILHFRKSKEFTFNTDAVRIPYGAHTLKYPDHPQAETSQYGKGRIPAAERPDWTPNPLGAKPKDVIELPTTCNGMGEKTPHPTQKPEELLRKLVLASSNPGDLVVDPFSGSGTTVVAAEQLGRRWLGCDNSAEHNEWAIERLERVPKKSVAEWVELDRRTAQRRESIR